MNAVFTEQLALPCFQNFDAFSRGVLAHKKTNTMQATLQLGLRCANLSQGFALGYRCALQSLLPQLDPSQWAAMCVTERDGNHPKHIEAQIQADGSVSGEKRFVTMAGLATQLIVIAKADANNTADTRPILKAVFVHAEQAGVSITPMPAMNLLADVPHGILTLEHATAQMLSGDGYTDYSKVFRVLEDAHILMAASSVILNQAYRLGQVNIVAKALGVISLLSGISLTTNEWVDLQLAQGFEQFSILCALFEQTLAAHGDVFSNTWFADKKLFAIAARARQTRTDNALKWLAIQAKG